MSPLDPGTRDWLRTWPLLLVAAVAFALGALAFFKQKDMIASAASMTTGVLTLGLWCGVEIYRAGRFDRPTETPAQLEYDSETPTEDDDAASA
jgi:hypothetical protein